MKRFLAACLMTSFICALSAQVSAAECQGPATRAARHGLNPWAIRGFLANQCDFFRTSVGAVRIEAPWQEIEPEHKHFAWGDLDQVVAAAEAHHVTVLLTLRSVSSWGTVVKARGDDLYRDSSAPKDLADWQAFLTAMARRYAHRGVAYEIENEPNSPAFWKGTMPEYIALLRASFQALKSGDPDATVVSGALACHIVLNYRTPEIKARSDADFDLWQLEILRTKAFTAVGVHDYYFPDHAVNGWTFSSYLENIRRLANQVGVANIPVWITEVGYVSRPQPAGNRVDEGSPVSQGRWAAEAYRQATQAGAERVFWLFLRDQGGLATNYFSSMGLLDANGSHRPAYAVVSPGG